DAISVGRAPARADRAAVTAPGGNGRIGGTPVAGRRPAGRVHRPGDNDGDAALAARWTEIGGLHGGDHELASLCGIARRRSAGQHGPPCTPDLVSHLVGEAVKVIE